MVALLLLFACEGPSDTGTPAKPDDTAADTAVGTDSVDTGASVDTSEDTGPPDADGDGFPEAEDCDDADPYTHRDAEEWCDERDHDCDGEPLAEGVCGKAQLLEAIGDAAITYADGRGPLDATSFGDLDGDGAAEIAILVARASDYNPNGRAAWGIVSGLQQRDDVTTASRRWVLEDQTENFDHWLPAGDFDGDGWSDVVFVSYGVAGPAGAHVVRGPSTSWPAELLVPSQADASWPSIRDDERYDMFGYDADAGGDVNGDGLADILVSDAEGTTVQTVLIAGRSAPGGSDGDMYAETLNTGVGKEYVAFTGDQDGDGRDDIVSNYNVLLWASGGSLAIGQAEPWEFKRVEATTEAGCRDLAAVESIPRIGDWTGDGLDDLAVYCGEDVATDPSAEDTLLLVDGGLLAAAQEGAEIHEVSVGSWNFDPGNLQYGSLSTHLADVDGDDIPDILTSSWRVVDGGWLTEPTLLLSSDGVPAPFTDPTERGWSIRSELAGPEGSLLVPTGVDDFDGDGRADLAMIAYEDIDYSDTMEAWVVYGWELPWHDAAYW